MSKIIKSKIVHEGIFIKVRHDIVDIEGNSYTKEIVESNPGVLVAAIDNKNRIALIRQHRHNLGEIYEVPSGAIKKSETFLEGAKRELLEETGLVAKSWELTSTHQNGVHNEGLNYFFIAQNLTKNKRQLDEDEEIEDYSFLTFEEVNRLMKDKLIPDLRSRACIWKAQLELIL